jgi:hypothetical protein
MIIVPAHRLGAKTIKEVVLARGITIVVLGRNMALALASLVPTRTAHGDTASVVIVPADIVPADMAVGGIARGEMARATSPIAARNSVATTVRIMAGTDINLGGIDSDIIARSLAVTIRHITANITLARRTTVDAQASVARTDMVQATSLIVVPNSEDTTVRIMARIFHVM